MKELIKTAAVLFCFAVGIAAMPKDTAETEFYAISPSGVRNETEETETELKKNYTELEAILTAYCPCVKCSEGYGRNTATGNIAKAEHTAAVDPKIIPYGTKIEIDGIIYTAEDCGGAVRGCTIDIFFDTHAETVSFGRQKKTVKIFGE